MKLVACRECHAQYDVTGMVPGSAFDCRCGAELSATPPEGVDAKATRCSACGAVAREGEEVCAYCRGGIVTTPSRGSLICPECMARNLEDARFCLACGVGFEPRAVVGDTPELRCPCCERWMAVCEVGGFVVQECPKCHGLWAGANVFEGLVDRAAEVARERAADASNAPPRFDGDNPAANRVEYRRCPECDALMARRNFRRRSGVIIDQCHEHGTWLDANELERVAGFVLSGRAASAARVEAGERANRDSERAREAVRRVETANVEPYESALPGMRERWNRPVADTVVDFLISLLH